MNLKFAIPAMVLLASVSIAFPVTWQMDSSPFSFPATNAIAPTKNASASIQIQIFEKPTASDAITISYMLPAKSYNGTMAIFNVQGKRLALFHLPAASGLFTWRAPGGSVPNGIYIIEARSGAITSRTQLFVR